MGSRGGGGNVLRLEDSVDDGESVVGGVDLSVGPIGHLDL